MSNKLDQVIDISISLSTKSITQQGFGIPMILGTSMKLDKRLKEYLNISAVTQDFSENDVEYKMAEIAFSQEKTPKSIMIGKKVVLGSAVVISSTRVDSSGEDAKRATVIVTDSNIEVGATAIFSGFSTTSYNGNSIIIEKVDKNTFVVEYTSVLDNSTASGSGSVVISETWSNAIQKIFDYNQNWYCAVLTSNIKADILSAASKIETLKRFLIVRTSDEDALDSTVTGSVIYQLKTLNYDRTALIWNGDTTNKFIDIAWAGRMLPTIPGSENWAWKNLVGVSTDEIDVDGIKTNNGNTYETYSGRNATALGKCVSGEYIDIIRGTDWLKTRLQENLYLLLINSEKVAMENRGGILIENAMMEIFEQAVQNEFIRKDNDGKGLYSIDIPDVSDIPLADRLNRIWSGITFHATLAGAINKISVSGNLSL